MDKDECLEHLKSLFPYFSFEHHTEPFSYHRFHCGRDTVRIGKEGTAWNISINDEWPGDSSFDGEFNDPKLDTDAVEDELNEIFPNVEGSFDVTREDFNRKYHVGCIRFKYGKIPIYYEDGLGWEVGSWTDECNGDLPSALKDVAEYILRTKLESDYPDRDWTITSNFPGYDYGIVCDEFDRGVEHHPNREESWRVSAGEFRETLDEALGDLPMSDTTIRVTKDGSVYESRVFKGNLEETDEVVLEHGAIRLLGHKRLLVDGYDKSEVELFEHGDWTLVTEPENEEDLDPYKIDVEIELDPGESLEKRKANVRINQRNWLETWDEEREIWSSVGQLPDAPDDKRRRIVFTFPPSMKTAKYKDGESISKLDVSLDEIHVIHQDREIQEIQIDGWDDDEINLLVDSESDYENGLDRDQKSSYDLNVFGQAVEFSTISREKNEEQIESLKQAMEDKMDGKKTDSPIKNQGGKSKAELAVDGALGGLFGGVGGELALDFFRWMMPESTDDWVEPMLEDAVGRAAAKMVVSWVVLHGSDRWAGAFEFLIDPERIQNQAENAFQYNSGKVTDEVGQLMYREYDSMEDVKERALGFLVSKKDQIPGVDDQKVTLAATEVAGEDQDPTEKIEELREKYETCEKTA